MKRFQDRAPRRVASLVAVALLSSIAAFSVSPSPTAGGASGGIDVHMHLSVGAGARGKPPTTLGQFPARGPGRRPPPGQGRIPAAPPAEESSLQEWSDAAENLVAEMDRLGIDKAVVMPPPQKTGQARGYDYREFVHVIGEHRGRLFLGAGGGILSPMIFDYDSSAVTTKVRAKFRAEAERIAEAGAKAFGEMTALHFSFHDGHVFLEAEPDHPLFLELADVAAERGMPIDLHMEAVPMEMAMPSEVRERSGNNPRRIRANTDGLERLLAHNRKATVVWVHAGWDNTGFFTPALIGELLVRNDNLYIGIKHLDGKYEPWRRGISLVDSDSGTLNGEWRALFLDHSDRVLIGADEFVGAAGQTSRKGPPSLESTWALLPLLPASVRDRIAFENARRLYNLD